MAGCMKISDPPAVVGGYRRGMPRTWKATVLAAALLVGGSIEALAQDPPAPAPNKVWGGCVLNQDAVDGLIGSLEATGGIPVDQAAVSFVVVYTLTNPNNGQLLDATPNPDVYSGPVICTNPAVAITAEEHDLDGGPLKETSDIPGSCTSAPCHDTHPAGAADDIDINSAEEVFLLQYTVNGGDLDGTKENRVCHTTDANVDCFRFFAPD